MNVEVMSDAKAVAKKRRPGGPKVKKWSDLYRLGIVTRGATIPEHTREWARCEREANDPSLRRAVDLVKSKAQRMRRLRELLSGTASRTSD